MEKLFFIDLKKIENSFLKIGIKNKMINQIPMIFNLMVFSNYIDMSQLSKED